MLLRLRLRSCQPAGPVTPGTLNTQSSSHSLWFTRSQMTRRGSQVPDPRLAHSTYLSKGSLSGDETQQWDEGIWPFPCEKEPGRREVVPPGGLESLVAVAY